MEEYRETNTKLDTKNTKQKRKFFVGLVLILCLLFGGGLIFGGSTAEAASLYFSPSSGSYNVGSNFSVNVLVSSPDQSMNAAGGVVSFPRDKLEITSLSKSDSIITFWAYDPTFSNTAGTVNFEGVVLPDGFEGRAGRIITLNFRTKAAGTAPLRFSEGSVLAHDGKGTNILRALGTASYTIAIREFTPSEEEYVLPPTVPTQAPASPVISSPTHPDSNRWYANDSPKFAWNIPSGVNATRLLVGRIPTAYPTVLYEPPISERQLEDLTDGVWYFSVQFRNKDGWGEVGRFKFQIDTEPPEYFTIAEIPREDLTKPMVSFEFDTEDETSGISHYEIWINDERQDDWQEDNTEVYTTPVLKPGKHELLARAVDFAGNYLEEKATFNVAPVESPKIISYPSRLAPGDRLTVQGTALPFYKAEVWIVKDGREEKIGEEQVDQKGTFEIMYSELLERGDYKLWAVTVSEWGARSERSKEVELRVELPFVLQFGRIAIDYLTLIITLIVLIVGAVVIILYGWYKISLWRKKVRSETKEATQTVSRAFKSLQEEVKKEIKYLNGKPGLTREEREIREKLKEALNNSEKSIKKEIKDIEKELE